MARYTMLPGRVDPCVRLRNRRVSFVSQINYAPRYPLPQPKDFYEKNWPNGIQPNRFKPLP